MLIYKIINGDSRKVDIIPNSSIHLALTSPPYGSVVDYNRADPNNIGNYDNDEYKKMITEVYKEVFRVLKPGRKFAVNIADTYIASPLDEKSSINEYGRMTVDICRSIGFELEVRIIWDKGLATSLDLMGSWPRPASPIIFQKDEWIFIFRKPGVGDYSHISDEERQASTMSTSFIKEHVYSVWHIKPENSVDWHPAPFPVALPEAIIRMYSFVGEIIYEPFLGSGTTMVAAKNWGRSCIGTEIGYKTPDDVLWIDHLKKKVGWNEGDVYGKQVAYEFVTADGKVITDVVKGIGIEKLQEKISRGPMDAFSEEESKEEIIRSEILFHIEGTAEKKDTEEKEEYRPTGWKKQKTLFGD
jgi:modification methylase